MTRPNVWLALLKQNWQFLSKFLVPLFLCELQIKAGKPFSLFCFFLMILNFREKNSLMLSFKNSNEFFKIAALLAKLQTIFIMIKILLQNFRIVTESLSFLWLYKGVLTFYHTTRWQFQQINHNESS